MHSQRSYDCAYQLRRLLVAVILSALCQIASPRQAFAVSKCTGLPQEIANCIYEFCLSNPALCNKDGIAAIVGTATTAAQWQSIWAVISNYALSEVSATAVTAATEATASLAGITGTEIVVGGGAAGAGAGAAAGVGGVIVGAVAIGVVVAGAELYAIARPDDIAYWFVPSPPDTCPSRLPNMLGLLKEPTLSRGLCQDLQKFSKECMKAGVGIEHPWCIANGYRGASSSGSKGVSSGGSRSNSNSRNSRGSSASSAGKKKPSKSGNSRSSKNKRK